MKVQIVLISAIIFVILVTKRAISNRQKSSGQVTESRHTGTVPVNREHGSTKRKRKADTSEVESANEESDCPTIGSNKCLLRR